MHGDHGSRYIGLQEEQGVTYVSIILTESAAGNYAMLSMYFNIFAEVGWLWRNQAK